MPRRLRLAVAGIPWNIILLHYFHQINTLTHQVRIININCSTEVRNRIFPPCLPEWLRSPETGNHRRR